MKQSLFRISLAEALQTGRLVLNAEIKSLVSPEEKFESGKFVDFRATRSELLKRR